MMPKEPGAMMAERHHMSLWVHPILAHGRFDDRARDSSLHLWASMHRRWLLLGGAGLATAALVLALVR